MIDVNTAAVILIVILLILVYKKNKQEGVEISPSVDNGVYKVISTEEVNRRALGMVDGVQLAKHVNEYLEYVNSNSFLEEHNKMIMKDKIRLSDIEVGGLLKGTEIKAINEIIDALPTECQGDDCPTLPSPDPPPHCPPPPPDNITCDLSEAEGGPMPAQFIAAYKQKYPDKNSGFLPLSAKNISNNLCLVSGVEKKYGTPIHRVIMFKKNVDGSLEVDPELWDKGFQGRQLRRGIFRRLFSMQDSEKEQLWDLFSMRSRLKGMWKPGVEKSAAEWGFIIDKCQPMPVEDSEDWKSRLVQMKSEKCGDAESNIDIQYQKCNLPDSTKGYDVLGYRCYPRESDYQQADGWDYALLQNNIRIAEKNVELPSIILKDDPYKD